MSILLRAIEMISKMKSKAITLESFSLFILCCYFKGATSEIRNKSAVVVIENSDHNRITSMSCLKKVIVTVDTESGKSFTNVVLWSDGMEAQFRSRFLFQLLVGRMFLNKSLCWFYDERHHGKVPMDDRGGTIKNAIFWKIKSGQIVFHLLKESFDAAMRSVFCIITLYLPKSDEVVESEIIQKAPSIPKTLSIHKFVRQINGRGDFSIQFFTMVVEVFYTQWYNKAGIVICRHEKSNKSNNECSTCGQLDDEIMMKWRVLTLFCINM